MNVSHANTSSVTSLSSVFMNSNEIRKNISDEEIFINVLSHILKHKQKISFTSQSTHYKFKSDGQILKFGIKGKSDTLEEFDEKKINQLRDKFINQNKSKKKAGEVINPLGSDNEVPFNEFLIKIHTRAAELVDLFDFTKLNIGNICKYKLKNGETYLMEYTKENKLSIKKESDLDKEGRGLVISSEGKIEQFDGDIECLKLIELYKIETTKFINLNFDQFKENTLYNKDKYVMFKDKNCIHILKEKQWVKSQGSLSAIVNSGLHIHIGKKPFITFDGDKKCIDIFSKFWEKYFIKPLTVSSTTTTHLEKESASTDSASSTQSSTSSSLAAMKSHSIQNLSDEEIFKKTFASYFELIKDNKKKRKEFAEFDDEDGNTFKLVTTKENYIAIVDKKAPDQILVFITPGDIMEGATYPPKKILSDLIEKFVNAVRVEVQEYFEE